MTFCTPHLALFITLVVSDINDMAHEKSRPNFDRDSFKAWNRLLAAPIFSTSMSTKRIQTSLVSRSGTLSRIISVLTLDWSIRTEKGYAIFIFHPCIVVWGKTLCTCISDWDKSLLTLLVGWDAGQMPLNWDCPTEIGMVGNYGVTVPLITLCTRRAYVQFLIKRFSIPYSLKCVFQRLYSM